MRAGDHILRGQGEGNAWPLSIRQAVEKVEQQAQKVKGKWARAEAERHPPRARTVRAAAAIRPPRAERAEPQAPAGDSRHSLCGQADVGRGRGAANRGQRRAVHRLPQRRVVDAVSIVYRRKDGQLGLIEPD